MNECKRCHKSFEITDEDQSFYDRVSPVINGVKYSVPEPRLCPQCRMQRRLSWRNERNLYKRKCDLTGRDMVSFHSPEKPYPVYYFKDWTSDKWDPMDYGREYDFNRPFFEQYEDLLKDVPKKSLNLPDNMENCDYCNYGSSSKNCYLCVAPVFAENCLYSWTPYKCTEDIDCYANIACQHCYESVILENCYQVHYSEHSKNCSESWFLQDCISCKNCFGCINLQQKEYCFLNEQLTKEEYEKRVSEIIGSQEKIEAFKKTFAEFTLQHPHKAVRNTDATNSTGDLLRNTKDCQQSFDVMDLEKCKYTCIGGLKSFDIYDAHLFGLGATQSYEVIGCLGGNRNLFNVYISNCSDLMYNLSCFSCEHCFGCEGLTHKKYCILNKQYTKEDYEALLPKIIKHMKSTGEWGEFFPMNKSLFAYNDSVAQEFFPMNEEETKKEQLNWTHYQEEAPKAEKKISTDQLPDHIEEIPKDILNWALECSETGRLFQLVPQELDFYQRMKIPIPRLHPDQRYLRRIKRKNPYKLWERNCTKCQKNMLTAYSPERPEILYCEQCYLNEVY
jgi:hypothetical protein